MITVPVTIVVGAGASTHWGLPTATELTKEARSLEPSSPVYELLHDACGISADELSQFLDALRQDEITDSIDTFLENEKTDRERQIGRALIAVLLGRHTLDSREQRPDRENDWIAYIVGRMRRDARTIGEFADRNRVTFVTFNFDSVLEVELERRIRQGFQGASDEQIKVALSSVPITHIHGRLPQIHELKKAWLQQAENRVRVVHDEIDKEVSEAAQDAIDSAHNLCFLGFSYHDANLERLRIRQKVASQTSPSALVVGTCYGMDESDKQRVKAHFASKIELFDGLCCAPLRHSQVLRDES